MSISRPSKSGTVCAEPFAPLAVGHDGIDRYTVKQIVGKIGTVVAGNLYTPHFARRHKSLGRVESEYATAIADPYKTCLLVLVNGIDSIERD